ncbi:MAG: hypothetical protein IPL89_14795 [Acidobacteria bacterium]|nr:hypothetical protein [Acidobacteriota bacterium]
MLLPFSDPEKAGFRLPARRDFVVALGGRATAAGLAPGATDGARAVPWWRENGRLHVSVNSVDGDLGLVIPYLDETFSLRPEASPETALAAFRRLETDFSGKDRGAILDGNMEEKQVVVHGPLRQFLVFSQQDAKEDRIDVVCRSVTEGSPMGRANVTARRIGDSHVFIGAFTLFPDGHPEPDTPPGRSITAPILKITVGESDTSCRTEESP